MICEKCKVNTATVHVKTIINGVVKVNNLCGYCAAEDNITEKSFGNMLASVFNENRSNILTESEEKCPKCNCTFTQIEEDGLVGCEYCYTAFSRRLLPYIKHIHGSTIHIGNTPNKTVPAVLRPEDEIARLRLMLNGLIKSEQFEQAAVVRDEIKKLEGEGK